MMESLAYRIGLSKSEFHTIKNEEHNALVRSGTKFVSDDIDSQITKALQRS